MWVGRWVCLAAVSISVASGSGPETGPAAEGCISWGLVQSLPLGIREPAEHIYGLVQAHPYLQKLFGQEATLVPESKDLQDLQKFLEYAGQAVGHAILHPKDAPVRSPASGTLPRDFGSMHPSIQFFVCLFNFPISFNPEYKFHGDEICERRLAVSLASAKGGPASIPLKLVEVQALRLLLRAGSVVVDQHGGEGFAIPPAFMFEHDWLLVYTEPRNVVKRIAKLCQQDWPQAVGSTEALSSLQAQLEQHVQDATDAFVTTFEAIAYRRRRGLLTADDGFILGMVIMEIKSTLSDDGIGDMSMPPDHPVREITEPQVERFRLTVCKFSVHATVCIIKLGMLVPEALLTNFHAYLVPPSEPTVMMLNRAEWALAKLRCLREGLQEAMIVSSADGLISSLQASFLGIEESLFPLARHIRALSEIGGVALEPRRAELFGESYVVTTDLLRIMDRAIEQALEEPDELRRYELVVSALLPRWRNQFLNGWRANAVVLLLLAQEILGRLRNTMPAAIPGDCEYDPEGGSALMRHFLLPPTTEQRSAQDKGTISDGMLAKRGTPEDGHHQEDTGGKRRKGPDR